MIHYSVLLPLPFSKPFTYTFDSEIKIGQLVKVPFHKKQVIGVVIDNTQIHDSKNLKSISKIYDQVLSTHILRFIEWVANYNMAPTGMVFKMIMGPYKHLDGKTPDVADIEYKPYNNFTLNDQQQIALEHITYKLDKNVFNVTLLEGITGSGKTEVYLKSIEHVLKSGGQVLVLLPEIVLTTQLISRFEASLGFKPIIWHSNISVKLKKLYWQMLRSGKARFVVGARSALFLPYSNLKLIIIDEEHDQSFKQEEGVIYNARDMAIIRARIEDISVLLASATPSIETIYNVQKSKYSRVFLNSRYGQAILPDIKIVDLNKQKSKDDRWISSQLKEQITSTIKRGEQTLLFLNRRGYAPISLCLKCKSKIECRNCNSYMVEHRRQHLLQCHYCGFSTSSNHKCNNCGSSEKFLSLGFGVERIEEEVKECFPHAKTMIFTSDTVKSHKEAEEVISSIQNNEVDILIGTQMTAKGLHFPRLNLVGVIEADKNLIGGDIRTLERMYQMLNQVAGRAGRDVNKGRVLIQTYQPFNKVLKNIVNQDSEGFYKHELEDRYAANMPPYSSLAILTLQSLNEQAVISTAQLLAKNIPLFSNIEILGPAPAPIYKIQNKFRYRFVIKTPRNISIQKVIKQWLDDVKIPSIIKIKIDIDPYNFL